jgi:magnesium transporter
VSSAVDAFEQQVGTSLHWIARHHLTRGSGHTGDPFPRIEEHSGYLFGIFYVPSDPGSTEAHFDEVVFAATHDHVIGTYSRNPHSTSDWPGLFETLSTDRVFTDADATGGRTLVRMLKTVVKQLTRDSENFDAAVNDIAGQLGLRLDGGGRVVTLDGLERLTHRERRLLQSRVAALRDRVAMQRAEFPVMRRVVAETETVLARLAKDEVDLAADAAGIPRELFTRELEIFVSDIHIDARHVSSLMEDIEYRLGMIRDYMKQLKDDENVSASRFTGAIASIMLVPTFIVGLYGQNFGENMPETQWRFGYLFSWSIIVAVTVGQVWFFRRRKWI